MLHTLKGRKADWIRHYLHIIQRKIEAKIRVMKRQGRRCRQIRDDLRKLEGAAN
jgi:hypothetical protein